MASVLTESFMFSVTSSLWGLRPTVSMNALTYFFNFSRSACILASCWIVSTLCLRFTLISASSLSRTFFISSCMRAWSSSCLVFMDSINSMSILWSLSSVLCSMCSISLYQWWRLSFDVTIVLHISGLRNSSNRFRSFEPILPWNALLNSTTLQVWKKH